MLRFSCADIKLAARAAAAALGEPGAVLLMPTETVYGLIARVGDKVAEKRIYELKGRSSQKPLGWFLPDWRNADRFGVVMTPAAIKLAARFCPGALTLIVPSKSGVAIGFRVPDHPLFAELFTLIDFPLVQTSANRSGAPNAVDCDSALQMLAGSPELVIDGGAIPIDALASTVVNAVNDPPVVLRQGAVKID
ncbi:MAG: L-threonylcarbamoyladenylate synthase [Victivallaceae bacterium]|nr:L-threonylcarbamoyladenylate synthase [Victivallaceae bacterium]